MPRNRRKENTYLCKICKAFLSIQNLLNPMEVSILNCLHPILQIWEQAQKVILLIKVTQEEFTLCSELQLKSFFFFLLLYAASKICKI